MSFKIDTNINLSSIAISLGANTNDWNPAGLSGAALIWITPTTTIDLTGLAGGEERRVMFLGLRAAGSNNVNIPASSGSSSAANRFAQAVTMSSNTTGSVVNGWIYLGSLWRRWK